MGFWSRLLRPSVESRHYVDLSAFTSFQDVEGKTGNTAAGVVITERTATTLPVAYRCIQIHCETISSMPVSCVRKVGEDRETYPSPKWVERPNDDQDWGEFIAQGQFSYEVNGNTFILKATTERGGIAGLYILNPGKTQPRRVVYEGRHITVFDVCLDDGTTKTLLPNEVIHLKGMVPPGSLRGLSPINELREWLGVGKAVEIFGAQFFGAGSVLSGVIESAKPLDDPTVKRLQEDFTRKHGGVRKSHAIGILSGGATWRPISVNAEESQFLETMRLNAAQTAYIFGIPPHMVADVSGAKGFVTGVMAGRLDLHQFGLLPRYTRWERGLSTLLPPGVTLKFNERGLLRGDATEQSALMTAGINNGVESRAEWRARLDLPPVKGADRFYMQGGLFALDDSGVPISPNSPPPSGSFVDQGGSQ
jgi:HK97 family phage portal protein